MYLQKKFICFRRPIFGRSFSLGKATGIRWQRKHATSRNKMKITNFLHEAWLTRVEDKVTATSDEVNFMNQSVEI